MSVYKVTVKWKKETFSVDLNTAESPEVFKAQLYQLTGVAPDKQKVMGKGVILKDSTKWSKVKKLKDGYTWMLIGEAGPLPEAPKEQTLFVEDLPPEARLAAEASMPAGLVNLGNTCYMNSTVQALTAVPELRRALSQYEMSSQNGGNVDALLTGSFKSLMQSLATSGTAVTPMIFLNVLRQAFPQFAEQTGHGYSQQDAEECFSQMLQSIGRQLPALKDTSSSSSSSSTAASGSAARTAIQQLFGIRLVAELKDAMDESAPTSKSEETLLKLQAHITGETRFLSQCLKTALTGQLEKNNAQGQMRVYNKESKIARLPLCVAVQFVRFFWKAGAGNKPGVKSKITRPVEFPLTLDLHEYCTDDLKASLKPVRTRLRELEDARLGIKNAKKDDNDAEDKETSEQAAKKARIDPSAATSSDMVVDETKEEIQSPAFENDTGYYELVAVVTHKGRDADGGHYVAWVKEEEDSWILFDDDKVSRKKDEDIKKLSGAGGSDWHLAYICLYRARRLKDAVDQWAIADKKAEEEKAGKK